jgi:LysM repeat protein
MMIGAIRDLVIALAASIAVGFGVVTLTADRTARDIESTVRLPAGEPASTRERPSAPKARRKRQPVGEVRYVVARGDTLWDIAARRYRDAAEGMVLIKKRNALEREYVLAGEVLVLPAAGRRDVRDPTAARASAASARRPLLR